MNVSMDTAGLFYVKGLAKLALTSWKTLMNYGCTNFYGGFVQYVRGRGMGEQQHDHGKLG